MFCIMRYGAMALRQISVENQFIAGSESRFCFAQNARERAAANRVLISVLAAAAAVGVVTLERGLAYSTPGFGEAERISDWGILLHLFQQEAEFNRAEQAQRLGLVHLFEVNLSNSSRISISWEKIHDLPGVANLANEKIGLTAIFTDEVLPPVKLKQTTPSGEVAEGLYYTTAGLEQTKGLASWIGPRSFSLVISTVAPNGKGEVLRREPEEWQRSFLHELGHLIYAVTTAKEREAIFPRIDWLNDPEGEIEGFAKAYERIRSGSDLLTVEPITVPAPTEKSLQEQMHRVNQALHWEAVRRGLLKS